MFIGLHCFNMDLESAINVYTSTYNVYQNTNFDDGIIIKPFRFYDSDGKLKNNKNASHQTLNRGSNHMRTANHN